MNLTNYAIAEGRLTKEPKLMKNKDGSKKVFVTVAVQDNFVSGKNKERKTQFINLEGFIPAGRTKTAYDNMATGDKVAFQYRIETPSYQKDGETVYRTVLVIESVQFKESKTEKDARQAAKAAAAADDAQAEVETPIE